MPFILLAFLYVLGLAVVYHLAIAIGQRFGLKYDDRWQGSGDVRSLPNAWDDVRSLLDKVDAQGGSQASGARPPQQPVAGASGAAAAAAVAAAEDKKAA